MLTSLITVAKRSTLPIADELMNVTPLDIQSDSSSPKGTDTKLVSVVITCYNQAHFLPESIGSVLSQTYKQFEIIVVDDESTDNPEQVVSTYAGVKFVRQRNQGVSVARNRGLQESQGEFVIFLDADDRLLPSALENGVKAFRVCPECGFVFGHGKLIDASGVELPESFGPKPLEAGYAQLIQQNPIGFPALVMYSRAALESIGGFRSFIEGSFIGNTADLDINLRVASRYKIYFHGNTVAEWRQHNTNTSNNSLMMLKSAMHVFDAQRAIAKGNSELEKALEMGVKRTQEHFGERLIQELRAESRAKKLTWQRLLVSVSALLRYYPAGLKSNALRKLKVLAKRSSQSSSTSRGPT